MKYSYKYNLGIITTLLIAIAWLLHERNLPIVDQPPSSMLTSEVGKSFEAFRRVRKKDIADSNQTKINSSELELVVGMHQRIADSIRTIGGIAALEYFRTLPFGEERRHGIAAALLDISRKNGIENALSIIKELSPNDVDKATVRNLFLPRNSEDLVRVISGLKLLSDPNLRFLAINEIAMATKDFKEEDMLLLINNSALSEDEKKVAEFCYAKNIVERDPMGVATMFKMFNQAQKDGLINDIITKWPVSHLSEGAAWMFANCSDQNMLQAGLWAMMTTHSNGNQELLMNIIANAPPSEAVDEAHGRIVDLMFDSDSSGVELWAKNLPEGMGRTSAMRALLGRIAQSNPIKAVELAKNSAIGERDFSEQISWVGHIWAQSDPSNGLIWADNTDMLSPSDRAQFSKSILQTWAMTDTLGLIKHGEKNPELLLDESVVNSIFQSYSRISMMDTANWMVSNNKTSPERLSSLVNNWLRSNPREASEWISHMKRGPDRNIAVTELVSEMNSYDPEMAATWAKELDAK